MKPKSKKILITDQNLFDLHKNLNHRFYEDYLDVYKSITSGIKLKTRVADYIANFLKEKGVKNIFMLTGYGAMYMNDAIKLNGIKYYATRNEATAPIMASAYAKSINDIVYEFSMTILPEVVKEFGIQNTEKSNLQIDVGNFIYDKDGNTKRKFMRFYYDKAKKLVRKPLIDKINRALGWRNNQNLSHNEILVHDFKIVNTKLIVSEESIKSDRMFEQARKEDLLHWDTIQASDVANLRKR